MANSIVHFELPAEDPSRAKRFYESVFNWTFREAGDSPIEYHMTEELEPVAAIYPRQADERGPVVYFDTTDLDGTIARVRELGGEAEEKQPIPGIGWFARCRDPEGNEFSLYAADESVPHDAA
ncbi:MAG TPA: VOC family protein [Gaiellaceae bacterium]|nr:VOC family protein [Gaiellaceae bacterium]